MSIHGEIFDVTVIGAGPVGLYAAIYAGTRGLRVKVIESQPQAGGRLITHYPEKTIYDVAGRPSIKAKDLVSRLVEQAQGHDTTFFFNQKVERIEADDEGIWTVATANAEHRSRTVIIAAGVAAFVPEKLQSDDAAELEGRGIFYSIDHMHHFKNRKVVVIGTGDLALGWAAAVAEVAEKVTLVHRLNRLTGPDDSLRAVETAGIELRYPFNELKEIHGGDRVEAVTIVNTTTGQSETLETDALVLNIGFLADLTEFQDWGLVVSQNSINVNESMMTNLPGVFAAGDIVTHPGKIKLISTGSGEAAIAVDMAARWIEESNAERRRSTVGARALEDEGIFYSGYEAVNVAILLEQQALEFYKAAHFGALTRTARETFAKMQRTTLDNIIMLKEEVLPVFSTGQYAYEDLDDTAAAYLGSAAARHLFAGADLAKEALKNRGSDLQNIYTGIQVEQDLMSFHSKLSNVDRLAQARSQFSRLVQIKEQELAFLRNRQAGMMETGIME